jgi:hypothetical protein
MFVICSVWYKLNDFEDITIKNVDRKQLLRTH